MYKCLSCGEIFEHPRWIREDYGQEFPHCPNCLDDNYADFGDLECPICFGIMANPSEHYCEECKAEIKNTMNAFMLEMMADGYNTKTEVVAVVREVADAECSVDLTQTGEKIALRLMKYVLEYANERGCSFASALEAAYDWSISSVWLKKCRW